MAKKKTVQISFDDLVERISAAIHSSMSGEELADLYNANFGNGMKYVGNDTFEQPQANYNQDTPKEE